MWNTRILGKFQCKKGDFGFVIPDDRSEWGWDFFVHQKNFCGAEDGQRVAAEILDRNSGKKPEAKVVEVFGSKKQEAAKKYEAVKVIEGIYSGGRGDFGFVDVEWEEQGYFVYGLKKNGAKEWDLVRADVKMYNGKEEAIVTEIMGIEDFEIKTGIFSDNDSFGFVKPDDKTDDVFIAGFRKADAKNGSKVEVKIIKKWGRRPEGVIVKVLDSE